MRLRNVPKHEEEDHDDSVTSIVRTLKTFDVYPKHRDEEDVAVKTNTGATISIISFTAILILFLTETYSYYAGRVTEHITVDTRTNQKLQINFNITFPALRCSATGIDVMDVSGEQQLDASANIFRTRLDSSGGHIGPWMEEIPALQHLVGGRIDTDRPGEGCMIVGTLHVNKVAGNVHIALGASHQRNVKHVHQFMIHEMLAYHASHRINQLSFGQLFPGAVSPLDGTTEIITEGSAHFQYFIKVIPTTYESDSVIVDTNQFSVTNQTHVITAMDAFRPDARKIPGVFLIYDLSPFVIRVIYKRIPFSTFATSLCAIVGGVFTVAGLIDSLVYHGTRMIQR